MSRQRRFEEHRRQKRLRHLLSDEDAQYHAELLLLLGFYVVPIYVATRMLVRLLFVFFYIEATVWALPFF